MTEHVDELMNTAAGWRREGQLESAKSLWEQSVALCRNDVDPDRLSNALKGLGQVERDLGNGVRALQLFREAEALEKQRGDTLRVAHTVRHVGDILRNLNRWDEAEQCYEEALAIYRAETSAPALDLANALRPMAIVQTYKGNVEAATKLWEEARALYEQAGVAEGVAECNSRLEKLTS